MIDPIRSPTTSNEDEIKIMDELRFETWLGKITTTHAWSFFSTGGLAPEIKISAKSTADDIEYKTYADDFFKKLQNGNKKCLKNIKSELRTYLTSQQSNYCCYCRRQLYLHGSAVQIDHIFPKNPKSNSAAAQFLARKLCFDVSNLAICCIDCNNAKSNKIHTYDPKCSQYSDYIDYNICISPRKNVIRYITSQDSDRKRIAEEIYSVFKLDRIEIRNIMVTIGDNTLLNLLESCIFAAEGNGALQSKVQELIGIYIDRYKIN